MGFLPVNVAGVAPAEDFTYPAGEYLFQIKEAKVEPTKDGQGFRLVIKTTILMGPGTSLDLQGKPFTHSFALTDKSRMFLVQFAQACGLQQQIDQAGGQIAEEWFIAKQYTAVLVQKDGYTNPTKIRPANAWTHGGAAGQPAAPQIGVPQPGLLQPMPGQPQQPQQAPATALAAQPQPQSQPQPQQYQIPTPQAPPTHPFQAPSNGQQPAQQPQGGFAAPPQPQQQFQQPAQAQPQAGFPAPPPPGQIPGQGQ